MNTSPLDTLVTLVMTIPQDATTLVLLTIALLPAGARGTLVTLAIRRQMPLLITALTVAAVTMLLPSLPWPALALLNLALLLALLPTIAGTQEHLLRWGAIFALGAFWTFQTFRTFYQTTLLPDGVAHFWFVDFVNKLVLVGLGPMLDALGARDAIGPVIGYLNAPIAFLSNHLLGLHLWLSVGAVVALTHILSATHRTLGPPPRWIGTPLPYWLTGTAITLVFIRVWLSDAPIWSVAREVGGGLLIVHGAGVLFALTATSAVLRRLFILSLLVSALHPTLVWGFGAIACLDTMTSVGRRWSTHQRVVSEEVERMVSTLRRRFGVTVICLTILPLAIIPYVPLAYSEVPDGPAPNPFVEAPAASSTVPIPGTSRTLDRLEHPNKVGVIPTTGLGPRAAESACRKEGKVLCDSDAWYEACSAGGHHFYVVPSRPYQRSILERMQATCNLYQPGRERGLKPAGAMARCSGPTKALDMAGNAFEWVMMSGDMPFYGLAGGFYGYADAQTPSCGFRVLIHPLQMPILEKEAIGFRCCSEP